MPRIIFRVSAILRIVLFEFEIAVDETSGTRRSIFSFLLSLLCRKVNARKFEQDVISSKAAHSLYSIETRREKEGKLQVSVIATPSECVGRLGVISVSLCEGKHNHGRGPEHTHGQ